MTCMYPICPSVFGTSSSSLMDQRALMPIDNNTNQPGSYPSHPTFTSHSSSSSSYSSSSKLFLRSSSYPLFHIHLHLSSLFLSNSSSFSSHNQQPPPPTPPPLSAFPPPLLPLPPPSLPPSGH